MRSTQNAKVFLEYYNQPEMHHLGNNVALLEKLEKDGFISCPNQLTVFLRTHYEILKKIDFTQTKPFNLQHYLQLIDPNHQLTLHSDKLAKGSPVYFSILSKAEYTHYGKISALFFEANMLTGKQVIAQLFGDLPRHEKFAALYHINNQTIWPNVKIAAEPIYSFFGPSAERAKNNFAKDFAIEHFYYQLIQHKIKYVVCLGHAGNKEKSDFIDYFTRPFFADFVDSNGNHVEINWIPQMASYSNPEYQCRKINYNIVITPPKSVHSREETGEISVNNIPMLDGHAINLSEDALVELHTTILEAKQNHLPIAVHCKYGWGRTGEFLFENKILEQGIFDQLFADDDHQTTLERLEKLVLTLRENCKGLILTKEQFFQGLNNAITVYNQLAQVPCKEEEKEIPQKLFHSPAFFHPAAIKSDTEKNAHYTFKL